MKSFLEALFILVMLAVGVVFCSIAGRNSYQYLSSQNWEPVSAHITEATWTAGRSRTSTNSGSYIPVFKAAATFEYDFDGQTYQSDRVSLLKGMTSDYDQQRRIHNRFKAHQTENKPHPAFVNPNKPSEAVLIREHSWMIAIIMIAFGGVALLLAGGGAWAMLNKD